MSYYTVPDALLENLIANLGGYRHVMESMVAVRRRAEMEDLGAADGVRKHNAIFGGRCSLWPVSYPRSDVLQLDIKFRLPHADRVPYPPPGVDMDLWLRPREGLTPSELAEKLRNEPRPLDPARFNFIDNLDKC